MNTLSEEDKHVETKKWIRKWCKKLKPEQVDWDRASDPTEEYNCMGFCMGPVNGKLRWWQAPQILNNVRMFPTHYWPSDLAADDSLDAFVLAAETCGFTKCDSVEPEDGVEKITLFYTDNEDRPFWHAAKHLTKDTWMSKIAEFSDIEHAPDTFDDIAIWGQGRFHMKRATSAAQTSDTAPAVP